MAKKDLNKLKKTELIEQINKLERKVNRLSKLDERYKNTLQDLKNSEAEFKAIYESANDGIFLLDKNKFIGCNKKALNIFECNRDQIIGKSPAYFSPEFQSNGKSSKELAIQRLKLAYEGKPQIFEWIHKKYDGTEFEAEVSLNRIELSKKYFVIAVVRDISERKRSESVQNAVYEIAQATLGAPDLDGLFTKIHEIIGRFMPANNFYIAMYEESIDKFTFPYFVDEEDDPPGPMKLGNTLTEYVYRTGIPLFATPEIMKYLEDKGEIGLVGSPSEFWIGVPLKTVESAIGVLAVQSYHKNEILKENDKDMLVFVSYQIAMAIRRVKTEKALEIEKKYFEELFNTAPEAMVILDYQSNIIRINREFTNVFGYVEEEVIGKSVDYLLTTEELRSEAIGITGTVKDGEHVSCETMRIKKDGTPVHVSILASPIVSEEEKLAVFGIYRDITVRKEAEAQIQKYNEELKALNKDKDKFFSIVAHDLKSPFTALLGYSEVISQECEELTLEEIKEFSTNIHDVAKNVNDLLNNLLDWSRIQTGRLKYEPEELNLFEISQKVYGLFFDYAKRKEVELINDVPKDLNISGDRNMIYTILRNLTSNALKFTKSGGNINIHAKENDKFIEISVVDTGVGMTEEVMSKLFNPESHHTTLGTEKEQGTGLGLRLCKEMVTKHGGGISVTSAVDEGSKFIFTIPKF